MPPIISSGNPPSVPPQIPWRITSNVYYGISSVILSYIPKKIPSGISSRNRSKVSSSIPSSSILPGIPPRTQQLTQKFPTGFLRKFFQWCVLHFFFSKTSRKIYTWKFSWGCSKNFSKYVLRSYLINFFKNPYKNSLWGIRHEVIQVIHSVSPRISSGNTPYFFRIFFETPPNELLELFREFIQTFTSKYI